MNGTRCPLCNDLGRYPSQVLRGQMLECTRCKPSTPHESAGIAPARASSDESKISYRDWLASRYPELAARYDKLQAELDDAALVADLERQGITPGPIARAHGLSAPLRGRQVPPLGVSQADIDQVVAELIAFDWRGGVLDPEAKRDPFTLTDDEPEPFVDGQRRITIDATPAEVEEIWRRRHDDIDPEKRAFWNGVAWGWCVGVVMTAAAVAWRLHGTLLP